MNVGKNVQKVCDTTGTGIQAAASFQLGPDVAGTLVSNITATGSFTIEVRISPEAPWATLGSAISTVGASITNMARAFPEMRINVSANTGTIQVWIMA